jgi:hypothetical protein
MTLVIEDAAGGGALSWPGPAQPDMENLALIYVTDTTDSGTEGSLRYAMEYPGPRRIIPTISGTIELLDDIDIVDSMMYYDGGAGPAPGLLVIGGTIRIFTSDLVFEHLHVRRGDDQNGNSQDCFALTHGSADIVLNHCSVGWGVDENLGINGYENVGQTTSMNRITISNCLIFEGLSCSWHGDGEHSKGALCYFDGKDILFYRCMFVRNKDRNPLFQAGCTGGVINCMHYWGYQPIVLSWTYHSYTSEELYHEIDIIGNKSHGYREGWWIRFNEHSDNSTIYMAGNNGPNDDWDPDSTWGNPHEANVKVLTPNHSYSGITPMEVNAAQALVIDSVGAFPNNRCATDTRVIQFYIDKTPGLIFQQGLGCGNENLVDSPDDVGWDLFPLYEP